MKKTKKQSAIESTLQELADLLPEISQAFVEVAQAPADSREAKVLAVSQLEDQADSRHLELVKQVGSTFITPFDREDLFELLESLDDIIDEFDLCARVLAALPIDVVPAPLLKSVHELRAMAGLMSQAVHLIKDPDELVKTLVQANHHYAAVRFNYVAFLQVSFEGGVDSLNVLQAKILADHIEEIAGDMEVFGRALGVMAIKET
jgi:uncharacterized protein Yka (UPF0111/DUF47 family)